MFFIRHWKSFFLVGIHFFIRKLEVIAALPRAFHPVLKQEWRKCLLLSSYLLKWTKSSLLLYVTNHSRRDYNLVYIHIEITRNVVQWFLNVEYFFISKLILSLRIFKILESSWFKYFSYKKNKRKGKTIRIIGLFCCVFVLILWCGFFLSSGFFSLLRYLFSLLIFLKF
jgi:hypothetical protein